jgi:hypothetical protein
MMKIITFHRRKLYMATEKDKKLNYPLTSDEEQILENNKHVLRRNDHVIL